MNTLMRKYAEWIIGHRLTVIVVITLTTALLCSQLLKLKIDNDPDLWAPQDHSFIKTTRQIEKIFGGRNYTLIGIMPKSGDIFQPMVLQKVRNIQKGIENIPEAVRHNIVSLAARKGKAIAGLKDGMEVHQMIETLPESPEAIARLKADIERNPFYIKALVSTDRKAVAVIADFVIDKQNPNYTSVYQAITRIVDKERSDLVHIHVGGLPVNFAWLEQYMMKMPLYFTVAFIIILAIQYWSFRSLQGMMLPSFTAILSVVWACGYMGVRGIHLDAMNMNTPILIMAVTAGHSIQILKRYYEEYRRLSESGTGGPDTKGYSKKAVVESLVRVGPIMIMAGLIAVIVFASLKISNIAMIRGFGEFAAIGILTGLILEMTFIPTLRSYLRAPNVHAVYREGRTSILDRMLSSLSNALMNRRSAFLILAATTGAILIVFAGIGWLRKDNSFTQYYNQQSQLRKDDAALNAAFAGTNSILFLVEGSTVDSIKDPAVLRGMEALQTFLDTQPYVGKTQSIADLIKRMNRAMHNDNPAFDRIPDSRNLVAQYLLLYSLSGEPQDFDSLVDTDYQKAVILVYMKTDSTAYAGELYEKAQSVIEKNFPHTVTVSMGGSLPQTTAINEVMISEKVSNIIQMAVVLFVLSSLILRSVVGGLFVLTPLVMVVMANFGFMGWIGITLDLVTATTASMAIAIGADYELYLMFRLKEEMAKSNDLHTAMRESYLTAGKAIILSAMSVAGGYSVMLSSDFGFYTRFSMVVVITMFVSAVSAVIILRSMMMIFKPRFIFGNGRETVAEFKVLPGGESI